MSRGTLPGVDDVIRIARSLGFELGADEAALYREQLLTRLRAIDDFMQMPLEEDRPPLLSPDRDPGHPASREEDPYNAWLWKCEIGGASEGLLAGKTVSFKDHIAVAGVPMTLGARLMQDHIPDFDATVVTRVLAAGGR